MVTSRAVEGKRSSDDRQTVCRLFGNDYTHGPTIPGPDYIHGLTVQISISIQIDTDKIDVEVEGILIQRYLLQR